MNLTLNLALTLNLTLVLGLSLALTLNLWEGRPRPDGVQSTPMSSSVYRITGPWAIFNGRPDAGAVHIA